MNKKIIIILALVVSVIVLTACVEKAGDVADAASRIADFTLPEGYQPELAVELTGYSIVMYNPGDGHSHLYLVQTRESKDVTQEKLETALDQARTGKSDKATRMTVVEKRAATIRGQEVTVQISEGTNSDGDAYRQATTAFQGKGGPALLVFSEPVSRWDDARLEALLKSIQ